MAQPNWITPAGSLGSYPSTLPVSITLSASASSPAVSLTFALLSGSLPSGLSLNSSGVISGTPTLVSSQTTSTFVIRVTDNLGSIRDRTFSMDISGSSIPELTTPTGGILSTLDSIWVELQLEYSNPDPENPITISLQSGRLPPGMDISPAGVIHGYAEPPISIINKPFIETTITVTETGTNIITCTSTAEFEATRPIVFTGTAFGGLVEGTTYYVKSVINNTKFTISSTEDGPEFILGTEVGSMTATLPAVAVGQPTISTYTFTIAISSPVGGSSETYSITVINQNTSITQGGPGYPINTRLPTIYNTRPSVDLLDTDQYFGYYLYPALDSDFSWPTESNAFIGTIRSDNYFAYKIIGHDFDSNDLIYVYSGLPAGLTGDPVTGWITGTPQLAVEGINQYSFSVAVYKVLNPTIQSTFFHFAYNLSNEIDGIITWISPTNLGTIANGEVCTKSILAQSDVELEYRLLDGELPPNLVLLSSGEITGYVANQPTSQLLEVGDTTEFTFTVEAYSPSYSIVKSTKTFTIIVEQINSYPLDTLYIKATPSLEDRAIIETLLTDDALIPPEMLYRSADPKFGKATEIIYEHAFGIYASDISQYLAAVTKNHYWRNITLGELSTAVAKDENGQIIYEVVYSNVIDNLINPEGVSISEEIFWPRLIDLSLGPWYTSVTTLYTSYASILGTDYYTSLTPGYARILYPNSLYNMRGRVASELGQEPSSRVLPLWMTSQQADGNTLGYTQAWVICYTKPGYAETIKNNILEGWLRPEGTPWKLNLIDFKIDRFFVNKQLTYNYNNITVPGSWTGLPSGTPVPDPGNTKDFYVLFPQVTILPNETQY
jgi:hypothetical protein